MPNMINVNSYDHQWRVESIRSVCMRENETTLKRGVRYKIAIPVKLIMALVLAVLFGLIVLAMLMPALNYLLSVVN